MIMRNEKNRVRKTLAHLLIVMMVLATVLPLQTGQASAAVKAPDQVVLKGAIQKGTTMTVNWEASAGASGYQIQYTADPDRIFLNKKSVRVKSGNATSRVIRKLSASERYYVRIRAYREKGSKRAYSRWTHSANLYNSFESNAKNVDLESLKKYFWSTKPMEMRKFAKQKVGSFDTVQGACYNKGYVYYLLEDRTVSYEGGRCIIVKMNLKKKKLEKISRPMPLCHGNDMTFDTKRNRIVVSHSTPYPKRISVINPNTLTLKYTKSVEMPSHVKGMTKGQRNAYSGFGAIAYNRSHDKYVVLLRGAQFHHLLLLDSSFKPVKMLYLNDDIRPKQTVQGMDSYGNYIVVCQSNGKSSNGKWYSHNNLLIYDWHGDFISKMTLGTAYELETVFHTASRMYVFYYTSYWKNKELQRDNYLYRLISL